MNNLKLTFEFGVYFFIFFKFIQKAVHHFGMITTKRNKRRDGSLIIFNQGFHYPENINLFIQKQPFKRKKNNKLNHSI